MANDPQSRFEEDQAVDPRIDSPAREGLTGTARSDIYEPLRDPEDVPVVAPDQFLERSNVARLGLSYKRQFFGGGVFSSCGLDGECHRGIQKIAYF